MRKRWLDAFPPKRPMQANTLAYVFPNLAFEHQLAIVRVMLDADHKLIELPWLEPWFDRNAYRILKLAKEDILCTR